MKKTITETIECAVSPYSLDGKIEDAIERLNELLEIHGRDARLDWDSNFYHPYDSNPSPCFHIRKSRPETDEEYQTRLEKEKRLEEETRTRELALLEALSKKYNK